MRAEWRLTRIYRKLGVARVRSWHTAWRRTRKIRAASSAGARCVGFHTFEQALESVASGVVAEYLVELYLPNARTACVGILARARRGAEQLTAEGVRVRFLRSILVPQDETCFCLYEAASLDAVGEAGRRAGLEFERIVEAVQVPENTPTLTES